MKIEVEVSDIYKGRDGNLYEPTGEFRNPLAGEHYAEVNSHIVNEAAYIYNGNRVVILKPKRWRAEHGYVYWFCASTDVSHSNEASCSIDDKRYAVGNYYKAEAQAQEAWEKIKQIYKEN